jgi:mRNA interferase RelE/StbE
MIRKIIYLKNAVKALEIYDKQTQKRIVEAIESIPQGDIKKMQGKRFPPLFRLRVGKYRIIYHFDNDEIIIAKIDTRGDVYK